MQVYTTHILNNKTQIQIVVHRNHVLFQHQKISTPSSLVPYRNQQVNNSSHKSNRCAATQKINHIIIHF